MSWKKIKNMFKKKPKQDKVITFKNGEIGLKYKLEPEVEPEVEPHTLYKGKVQGKSNLFVWEVEGMRIEAEDIISARRKYLNSIA